MHRRLVSLTLMGLLASGCVTSKNQVETMPTLTPPPAEDMEPMSAGNPGSLFNPGDAQYLFSDNRARRIGDIVLVHITESSTSKLEAKTDTSKDSSKDLSVENAFGATTVGIGKLLGFDPLKLNGATGTTPLVKYGDSSSFKGEGTTERKADVSATVAARVTKILPGGLMQVEGAREVRINDESQIMVVRGLVRPRDISSDNSVLSTHLADARIEYYGKGVLADKQKAGWLTRLLDNAWPF
ncbi:MAG: flagellar basal body L-ring protein FlgH [Desulfovibrio sp.]|nr:flagellar basal body L-ring protein FlgH [Desulfovibrio sp.]